MLRLPLRALALVRPVVSLLCFTSALSAEDGYELWLRYAPVTDAILRGNYLASVTGVRVEGSSETLRAAEYELKHGLAGLLGQALPPAGETLRDGLVIAGTKAGSPLVSGLGLDAELARAGDEGYVLRAMPVRGHRAIVIAANSDVGVLYGAFALLERIATSQRLDALSVVSAPRLRYRLLDHWDNLNRTIERGYAGFSLWDWQKLPDYLDPRYRDYARANASIGINGSVITSVNANATSLTAPWLAKAAALRILNLLTEPSRTLADPYPQVQST